MSFRYTSCRLCGGRKGVFTIAALVLSFCFQSQSQTLSGWTSSKKIVMNTSATGARIPGDVDGFPVAVMLNDTNFNFVQAKSNGEDIRFTDAAGAALPYQIEHWDATAKKAAIWVKVDVKGNNATQYITMHWGNSSATSESDGTKVFATADGWVGAWHLSETGNTTTEGYKDATANAAHVTGFKFSASNTVDGRVGKCPEFKYSEGRYLKLMSADKNKLFDLTKNITFSIWIKPAGFPEGYITMFAKGDNSWRVQMYGSPSWHGNQPASEMCVENYGDDCMFHKRASGDPNTAYPQDYGAQLTIGQWRLLTIVHNYPNVKYYVDTIMIQSDKSGNWTSDPAWAVGIGCQTQGNNPWRFWDGLLDEARVLSVSKDANWVKLNVESQKAASKFLEFGSDNTGIVPRSSFARPMIRGSEKIRRYDLNGRLIQGNAGAGVYLEKFISEDKRVVVTKRTVLPN